MIGLGSPPEDCFGMRFEAIGNSNEFFHEAFSRVTGRTDTAGWRLIDSESVFTSATGDPDSIIPFIQELCNRRLEFWLWYGSDWSDLPFFSDDRALCREILDSLSLPSFEVYAHFRHDPQKAEQSAAPNRMG